MKTAERLHHPDVQDGMLRWTMRVIGILLTVASIVFMQQDIFTSTLSIWFFGTCTGLGVITMISSLASRAAKGPSTGKGHTAAGSKKKPA